MDIKKYIIVGIILTIISIIFFCQNRNMLSLHQSYGVGCNQFMDIGNMNNWKIENGAILNQIKEKAVYIDFDLTTCEGKFGLSINHSSNGIKNEIIQIIGDTVFINSVPYEMNNL